MATPVTVSPRRLRADADGLAAAVRATGRAHGLDAVGFASADPFVTTRQDLETRKAAGLHAGMQFTYRNPVRATDPRRTLPSARSIVVGARCYLRRPRATSQPSDAAGIVARYAWADHYAPLRDALDAVAGCLRGYGWKAVVLVDDNALVDREAAYRAGLGWYGKNANLLLPGRGSWFVLGSVITDALLRPDAPVAEGCGSCSRCLPACPTGAIVEPGVIDGRRCLAWLLQAEGSFPREHREALGGRIYGCDDCQEVCPPNRAVERRRGAPDAAVDDEPAVDLIAMLDLDDAALLARFGRWYIPRRDPRYLRRNALVALGNVGRWDNGDVRRVVTRWASSDDALLQEHAVWAIEQLGGRPAEATTVPEEGA